LLSVRTNSVTLVDENEGVGRRRNAKLAWRPAGSALTRKEHARGQKTSRVRLNGNVHGTDSEGTDEEPGEAAGAIDGEEFEVIAGGDVQFERLPIPSIVDAQAMPAGSDWNRDGVALHEFGDGLAIELHDDLAELDIVRRAAADGDLRLRSL
jgi:hypothetical protein